MNNPNIVNNYLTNSLGAAKQFLRSTAYEIRQNIYKNKYGGYGSVAGPAIKNVGYIKTDAPTAAAAVIGDVLTDQTRREIWKYTNVPRMAGDIGKKVAEFAQADPVTGAMIAVGTPLILSQLSGKMGPITQGLRPSGYKAVAPVSKEKDPSGKKPQSLLLEAGLRYGLGQSSTILPYQDFKKERPDVAPSTYSEYRKYEYSKPEPGKLISIDPEGGTFTTVGGIVRGTKKGLNDPEIRIKGFPVTLSGAVGTAAGLGTAAALYKSLPKKITQSRAVYPDFSQMSSPNTKYGSSTATSLAIGAAGIGAATVVGYATKKLLQKSAEQRIKKDNPVEYLKHKHGSLEQASEALGQPGARSWQQLIPHIQ